MRALIERTTSFARGANDSVAPDEYFADQAQVMINARPSLFGNAAEWVDFSEPRSVNWNWGSLYSSNYGEEYRSSCFGAIEYYTAAGVQQIVAFFDDAAYYSLDGGYTFTAISGATGLDTDYWSFAIVYEAGSPVLCCANGGSNAYQWDGSTWSTISGIPSGVKFLCVHANRLIASGDSGAQVSGSKVGDIDTWAAPDGWVVNTNDGSDDDEVTGLYSIGGVVLVFKRRSFGYIEGFGYQTLQVAAGARGISRSVGCIAHRTIQAVGDNALMWLSERGFEYWVVGQPPQLVSTGQDRFVRRISTDILRTHPGTATAIWVPDKREYWCAVPCGVGPAQSVAGLNRNTWIYVYRPATPERPAASYFRYPTTSNDATLTVGTDGMLDISTSDLTNYLAVVDDHGMLDIVKLPDAGLWVRSDSDFLELGNPLTAPSSLYIADDGGRRGAPFAATYAHGIRALGQPVNEPLEYVPDGAFDDAGAWSAINVTIAGGVATFASTVAILSRYIPFVAGGNYTLRFTISGVTTGSLVLFACQAGIGSTISADGVYEVNFTVVNTVGRWSNSNLIFQTTDGFDGSIDDVSVVSADSDLAQIALLRTRPLTYGDELTRKKAKRISVMASQPFAHTATGYILTDRVYGTGQSLAFTAADSGQEQRIRVGGRGRVLQAEVHFSAECVIDAIEVLAKALRDER